MKTHKNMSRRSFLKVSALLGLSASLSSVLTSCAEETQQATPSLDKPIIIIGAGAAGLSAGYLLKQQGIDFKILEAAPVYGGRMKRTDAFADFPIPLGAEWLHAGVSELEAIVNDPAIDVTTKTIAYGNRESYGYYDYEDEELYLSNDDPGLDLKFIGSTWFDFFDQYVVPSVREHMQFNTQIRQINTETDTVVLTDQNGNRYEASKIIVAVPLKILQDGDITFTPPLPEEKAEAIATANIWGGIKVFLQFSEQFYPVLLEAPDSGTSEGQRIYYDAAYGQDSDMAVLGLFAVGRQAEPYQRLEPTAALRDHILAELDAVFDGRASQTYIKHVVQNWNAEPFIRAAYFADVGDWRIPPIVSEPVQDQIFFAGTAFTDGSDWGSVHNAAQSARTAVEALLS